jgi:hypothetical protein
MPISNFLPKNLTLPTLSDIIGGGKNLPPFTMDNTIDDGMRPWGHSDYEFLINNNMDEIIKQSPSTPWKYNEEEISITLLETNRFKRLT